MPHAINCEATTLAVEKRLLKSTKASRREAMTAGAEFCFTGDSEGVQT